MQGSYSEAQSSCYCLDSVVTWTGRPLQEAWPTARRSTELEITRRAVGTTPYSR